MAELIFSFSYKVLAYVWGGLQVLLAAPFSFPPFGDAYSSYVCFYLVSLTLCSD